MIMVNARAVIVIINSSDIVVLKIDRTMDKRIKKLALEGLINRVSADPGAGIGPAYLLKKDFVNRIIEVIGCLDEEVLLYLSGDVKVPEVGSSFMMRKGGEDVECVVETVSLTDATITLTHLVPKTYYFKTAEAAQTFTNTGKKGNYSDWDNELSEKYPYKGEHELKQRELIGFDQL